MIKINDLPPELLLKLPFYLEPIDLDMLSQSNSTFRNLYSNDNISWRLVCEGARIGRPDRSRSRSRSRGPPSIRDRWSDVGKRAASEDRKGRRYRGRGPINWRNRDTTSSDDNDNDNDIMNEDVDEEVQDEVLDEVQPLRPSRSAFRNNSNSRSRSRSRSRVRTAKVHPALESLVFNRATTTVESVEVKVPSDEGGEHRDKLIDHPQTYYSFVTQPPLQSIELRVGDHTTKVENDDGVTVCDIIDEICATINYLIMYSTGNEDGEIEPATRLVLDGKLSSITYVEPQILECNFEL